MFVYIYLSIKKKVKYKIHLFFIFFKIAWKHEPNERLRLSDILSKLETLYNKYHLSSLINCNDYDEESSNLKNSITLEQGIIFYNEKTPSSMKKAWECFVYHADNLNNPQAKYWKASYLYNGYAGVEKNLEEAKKLFKEAADNDIAEAQLFYARLLKNDNNPSVAQGCVEYFEMAAMNGIPAAMYYLGDIYYDGKYNVEKDQAKAISYFKEAAKNGHSEAKNRLRSLGL